VDISKVLYAAVALDPEMRLQYFECEWKDRPECIQLAKEKSKGLWKEDDSMGTSIMVVTCVQVPVTGHRSGQCRISYV